MVGIPGKSKGCNTCRRRKIGCGQERPVCSQCTRGNRECLGYDRERIFVNTVAQGGHANSFQPVKKAVPPRKRPKVIKETSQPGDAGQFSTLYIKDDKPQPLSSSESHSIVRRFPNIGSSGDEENTQMLLYSEPLREPLTRMNLLNLFLSKTTPRWGKLGGVVRASWLLDSYRVADSSPSYLDHPLIPVKKRIRGKVLTAATNAVGLGLLWQKDKSDLLLFREATRQYGLGISTLSKDLSALPHQMQTDEQNVAADMVLAGILMLGNYEMMLGGAKQGWMFHTEGAARLVHQRGPHAFMSGISHEMFLITRIKMVHHCLHEFKATFFAEHDWCTIPWTDHPKTLYDFLIDIIAQIPGLMEKGAMLENAGQIDLERREKEAGLIVSEAWEVYYRFSSWEQTMEACHFQSPLFTTKKHSPTFGPDADFPPFSYTFLDFSTAQCYLYYWASRVLLLYTFLKAGVYARGKFALQYFPEPLNSPMSIMTAIWQYAIKICCGAEYMAASDKELYGPRTLIYPLRAAQEAFSYSSMRDGVTGIHEARWCKNILETFGEIGLPLGTDVGNRPLAGNIGIVPEHSQGLGKNDA